MYSPCLSWNHRSQEAFFIYCVITICGVHRVHYNIRVQKHLESANNLFWLMGETSCNIISPRKFQVFAPLVITKLHYVHCNNFTK